MPAVFRGVLFGLLLASVCCGETLDEAVEMLARKISLRLTPGIMPRVTVRNLSSLSTGDAARAGTILERALRPAPRGTSQGVDVRLTISQTSRGYLLVTELQRNGEPIVAFSAWRPDAPAPPAMRTALQTHLLWEQDGPMLDVSVAADRMLILEPASIVVYQRGAAGWERPESRALDPAPNVRDPRGRLQVAGNSFTAFLPGAACNGSWTPALEVHCEAAGAKFPLGGEQVRLSNGRNTLEAEGWPPFFSFAQVEERGRPLYLAALANDRTSIYDGDHKSTGEIESWGDEFIGVCGDVLASSPSGRASADSLSAFELIEGRPIQTSEAAGLPGPVLALWPAEGGALAIIRTPVSGRYAAYSISIDCHR